MTSMLMKAAMAAETRAWLGLQPSCHVQLVERGTGTVLRSQPCSTEAYAQHLRDAWEHLPSSLAGRTEACVITRRAHTPRAPGRCGGAAFEVGGVPGSEVEALARLVERAAHDAACDGRAAAWHNPAWGLAGCVRCGAVLRCGARDEQA